MAAYESGTAGNDYGSHIVCLLLLFSILILPEMFHSKYNETGDERLEDELNPTDFISYQSSEKSHDQIESDGPEDDLHCCLHDSIHSLFPYLPKVITSQSVNLLPSTVNLMSVRSLCHP
jgi:hypothetical protein